MNRLNISTYTLAAAMTLMVGCGPANAKDNGGSTSKTSATQTATNENGCVSRTFTESSVTTNGNLVTEHRRVTKTDMDAKGNILGTSTSEYAQSYNVGDTHWQLPDPKVGAAAENKAKDEVKTDAFLGLKFGDEFKTDAAGPDPDGSALLRAEFKPVKKLADFDDYYVYLTPKTHRVAKVCACAKKAVEPDGMRRRHYLIEALEKRYQTWARLCSFRLPYYAFDIAPDRYVTVCLNGASRSYETVLTAWDETMCNQAVTEQEQIREEKLRKRLDERGKRVNAAVDAF